MHTQLVSRRRRVNERLEDLAAFVGVNVEEVGRPMFVEDHDKAFGSGVSVEQASVKAEGAIGLF